MKTHLIVKGIKIKIALMVIVTVPNIGISQSQTKELPYSIQNQIHRISPQISLPYTDTKSLFEEDRINAKPPYRIGFPYDVDYDINNDGEWMTFDNGDRIWTLEFLSPNAVFIGVSFREYWLPESCKLFLYNESKSEFVGPYTDKKNKGTRNANKGFAAEPVYADLITLELFVPSHVKDSPELSIRKLVHGYVKYTDFGASGDCNRNINCEEGNSWWNEKFSVVWYTIDNTCGCSGSLLNTDDDDETNDYFLTAEHCIQQAGYPCYGNDYDADPSIGEGVEIEDITFYYRWESPSCTNPVSSPTFSTTTGATVIANNSTSDFALLQLDDSPLDLTATVLFYNGWNRSGDTPQDSTVCISHPSGDIKKIAIDRNSATSNGNYWRADDYEVGVTEGGSSGAPLYDDSKFVVGQLSNGTAACDGSNDNGGYDNYGKFSESWDGNATNIRQLRHWIDADQSEGETHTGLSVFGNFLFWNDHLTIDSDKIKLQDVLIQNSSDLVFNYEDFLIIEGEFEVEVGSTLKLSN